MLQILFIAILLEVSRKLTRIQMRIKRNSLVSNYNYALLFKIFFQLVTVKVQNRSGLKNRYNNLRELMGLCFSTFFEEPTNDYQGMVPVDRISFASETLRKNHISRQGTQKNNAQSQFGIEKLMKEDLRHLRDALQSSYSRMIEARIKYIRQEMEQQIEQRLDKIIDKWNNSQTIIKIVPSSDSKISWFSSETKNNDLRKYSQFAGPRLLSKLEDFYIRRRGFGSSTILDIQNQFIFYESQYIEEELNNLKQKLGRIFLRLVNAKIVEKRDKKIERINQRFKLNDVCMYSE